MSGPYPDEADFPAEEDWLDLTYPDASADFVERAWQRVQEVSSHAAQPLDAALLAQDATPEPSPGFVDAMLTRVRAEGAPSWQRMLAEQRVPEPSPDFVDRVLSALQEDDAGDAALDTAAPIHQLGSRRSMWLAAAALLLAAIGLFSLRPFGATEAPVVAVAAAGYTPDPVGTTLSALGDDRLDLRASRTLRLARLAGLEGTR